MSSISKRTPSSKARIETHIKIYVHPPDIPPEKTRPFFIREILHARVVRGQRISIQVGRETLAVTISSTAMNGYILKVYLEDTAGKIRKKFEADKRWVLLEK